MSDGFDKEAEREKLREKLADDEQKREHTQRMSELLLKGATMTNRHCEECGDPIFRHDGREFCPSCGNEVGGAAGGGETTETAAGSGGTAADANAAAADPAENGSADPEAADAGTADADTSHADAGTADPTDADAADAGATETAQPRSAPPTGASTQASAPARGTAPPQRSESQRPASRQSAPSRSADDAEGIGAARASLTRTLTRFARAAEETDDPRRARDHLEAAREAAEALAALER